MSNCDFWWAWKVLEFAALHHQKQNLQLEPQHKHHDSSNLAKALVAHPNSSPVHQGQSPPETQRWCNCQPWRTRRINSQQAGKKRKSKSRKNTFHLLCDLYNHQSSATKENNPDAAGAGIPGPGRSSHCALKTIKAFPAALQTLGVAMMPRLTADCMAGTAAHRYGETPLECGELVFWQHTSKVQLPWATACETATWH